MIDLHPENVPIIDFTLDTSHFEISGRDNKEEQFSNKSFMLVTLIVFHLDISDKYFNDLQQKNYHPCFQDLKYSILKNQVKILSIHHNKT